MQLTDIERKEIERTLKFMMENDVSHEFVVKKIELIGGFFDIETISSRSKRIKKSDNGVRKCRELVNIFGKTFVIGKEKE